MAWLCYHHKLNQGFELLMRQKQSLINKILNIEWAMFQGVKGETPSSCQRMPGKFRKIRGSIFRVWSTETLESYLHDLKDAQRKNRNLLTEKYARMDNRIPPLRNNPLIEEIVKIETRWQEELRHSYPTVFEVMCRTTNMASDGSNFSIYLKCEVETYSDKTIALYFKKVKEAQKADINLTIKSLEILLKEGGFSNITHAERYLADLAK